MTAISANRYKLDMTYDQWKTRSPDDLIEDEQPSDLMQFMDYVDMLCQSGTTCPDYWARVESFALQADLAWKRGER